MAFEIIDGLRTTSTPISHSAWRAKNDRSAAASRSARRLPAAPALTVSRRWPWAGRLCGARRPSQVLSIFGSTSGRHRRRHHRGQQLRTAQKAASRLTLAGAWPAVLAGRLSFGEAAACFSEDGRTRSGAARSPHEPDRDRAGPDLRSRRGFSRTTSRSKLPARRTPWMSRAQPWFSRMRSAPLDRSAGRRLDGRVFGHRSGSVAGDPVRRAPRGGGTGRRTRFGSRRQGLGAARPRSICSPRNPIPTPG
jgi:hypothetical protein